MKMKFYRCEHCGNIIAKVEDSGIDIICCGDVMKQLVPGTTDGAHEKHVPVCRIDGNMVYVKVGSEEHPMEDGHFIEWIAIETDRGNQRKCLTPGDKPEACFALCEGENVLTVYEYCNIHGLWKADI